MKWLFRLLGLLGVVVLLAAVVAVYLVATFDPGAYRERIEEQVTEATGREFRLAGDIGLTLFPAIGLRLEGVSLANAPEFGDVPFAEAESVDVAVAVLPLLRRELEVLHIDADGVSVALTREQDGRNNWDDLVERLAGETAPPDAGTERGDPERAVLGDFSVAGVDLTRVRVEWDDRQAGTRMVLDPANLRLRQFRPGADAPLELDGSARLEQQGEMAGAMHVRLDALLNADPAAQQYALRGLASDLELQLRGVAGLLHSRLTTDVSLDLATGVVRIEDLSAALGGMELAGDLEIGELGREAVVFDGRLRSNVFNPRLLLSELGLPAPDTADPSALQRMELELALSGNARELALDPLRITVDESTLRGNAGVRFAEARPALSFRLEGDRLDLDRYLPPEVEQARVSEAEPPPGAPPVPEEVDVPVDLPAELMRAVDLDGRLTLGTLTLLGLTLESIEINLRARDGEWKVEPFSGRGYEGRIEGQATADASAEVPRYALAVSLTGVAIEPLLAAFRQDESRLIGTGNLALDVTAAGASVGALTSSLNGSGNMRFADGAVRGINIARIIRQADARLRGERPEDDGEPNQTDFTELSGSFRIVDGVVHNDDLAASSPLLRATGRGSADLPEQALDYRVDATLVATIEGQGGRSLDDLRGVNLPIRITGAFAEPRFRLDLDDVVRERVEDRVRREAGRLQERLLERLGVEDRDADVDADADADPAAPAETPSGSRIEDELQRLRDRLR
ncbi:AsmA family protein [Thioalkalivibrio paradoxus]|uniref:Membrane assembly protein AsmA n=1 Tax=Thioalkalivibrio paradoxus ARh 1 TaxID=713585 RepID=W0DEY6_9GAMM|nr:AsmA family protein [Thioalkalivibrio paradoxus]AHE97174.1 membrane assembly protein AsmA [Thioalkalivibrio paradoxus ARh 1]